MRITSLLLAVAIASTTPQSVLGVIRFFHHEGDQKWWVAGCTDSCPEQCDVTTDDGKISLGTFTCTCPEACPSGVDGSGGATTCDISNLNGTPLEHELQFLVGRDSCTINNEAGVIVCADDCAIDA
mmetsp:Transcript_36093/g.61545  ORF Transcript_36093/g.61545 Transcript_36093/m.61545 type:complete len:126 (+) Transcript_36093:47-424(+)